MEFSLFSEIAKLNPLQIALLAIGVVVVVLLLLSFQRKGAEGFGTKALIYAAMCVSLAFVLSFLRFFRMPQGGSITFASMLPIMVYSYWFGARRGLLCGLVFGVLQYIQDPFFVHPMQIALDYGLAFCSLAITGLFGKKLLLGITVAGLARIVCHIVSGAIFFAMYAPEGQNPWVYSTIYNVGSIGPDLLICIVVAAIAPMRAVIESLKRSVSAKTA